MQAVVDAALGADARVAGWGLVGSYGRGAADEWSDLDVLVAIRDEVWDDDVVPGVWPPALAVVDGRRNVRTGAHAVATAHDHGGALERIDWYLHPVSRLAWPSDCRVVVDVPGVGRVAEPFADWNARGERRRPLPPDPERAAVGRTLMAAIVAKSVARGHFDEARAMLAARGVDPADDDLLAGAEQLVDGATPVADGVRVIIARVRRASIDARPPRVVIEIDGGRFDDLDCFSEPLTDRRDRERAALSQRMWAIRERSVTYGS